MPLLEVKDLTVSFSVEGERKPAVQNVSFVVEPGEILGVVGESGSGKSVTGMSIMRLVPQPPGNIESGEIIYKGEDLLKKPVEELRAIRGSEISVIFQEPMTALSPLHPVGKQLRETALLHNPKLSKAEGWALGVEWLEKVGIPDAAERAKAYPFQFSGGMRQRVMIAMALMLEPKLIIADEPTTALDVTIQAQIFDLILKMKRDDTSIIFITHDMGVIWELSDRVIVMKDSRIVERGDIEDIFANPKEQYTKDLLAAVPRLTDKPLRQVETTDKEPLISVRDLKTWFPVKAGVFARTVDHVYAVNGVSFDIFPGETLGLVGESGSGKSTIGRTMLGLDDATSGSVTFKGKELIGLPRDEFRPLRRDLQMIFQDPFSSLNPRLTVLEILTEGLREHDMLDGQKPKKYAEHWLNEVGLLPEHMDRYPHEFSGGQRQRICIARAIAVHPKFVVCDEAVSALDVTIQAQVIDLLIDLREKHGLSYLFISHDLSVVKRICDRVVVLNQGTIVEQGNAAEVIEKPVQDYTKRLLAAVPIPGDKRKRDLAQAV